MNFDALHDLCHQFLQKGVPGLELYVYQDHQIRFHECAGHACTSDRYWLYSCTKPVTAAAAMLAMEQGLFRLDAPVSAYLPCYADAFLLQDGIRKKLKKPMTIRHLLTMTSGLDYDLQTNAILRVQKETEGMATTIQIANALTEAPLNFQPGERFQYGLSLDVIGAVIEIASGMTLREYMKEHFFLPLQMTDTDFSVAAKPDRLAPQYRYDPQTKTVQPLPWQNWLVISPNCFSGGAGLISTAADYAKFADALSCGGIGPNGVRILSPESIDLMRREQLTTFHVDSSFSCTCGSDYGYGLGVRTRTAFEQGKPSALGEFGWDGAAGADLLVDPERQLSMVYMQQVHNWPSMLGTVHLQIRDILYGGS